VPQTQPPAAAPANDNLRQGMPWWVLPGLGLVLVLSLDFVTGVAFLTGDATLKPVLATGLLNLAAGAMGFFFGSSMGSAKKDDTIAASSAALATSAPVTKP
jgi:hypothetical protein